ncbi:MAG TPA: VOC family protein [Vicinamibacteria bacterium]|nr:VOC family protein [Vicinamibacteria bacterium]
MAAKKKAAGKKRVGKKTASRRRPAGGRRPVAELRGLQLRSAEPSLTVNDIERSLAWYRDVLGFSVGEQHVRDGKLMGVELAAGDVHFWLGQDDWQKGRDRKKGEGFRIYGETRQDVDLLAERVQAAGGTLEQEPHDVPWGGRAFSVVDPDGFRITISRSA